MVSGTKKLKEGIGTMKTEVEAASGSVSGLNDAVSSISSLGSGLSAAGNAVSEAVAAADSVQNTADSTNTVIDNLADRNAKIDNVIATLQSAQDENHDFSDQIDQLKAAKSNVPSKVSKIEISSAKGTFQTCGGALNSAKTTLVGMSGSISQLSGVAASMAKLNAGISDAYKGAVALEAGAQKVSAGLQKLEASTAAFPTAAAGIATLNKGFDTLTANNDALTTGATALKTNTPAVTQGIASLATGAKQLDTGAKTLLNGTNTLNANNQTLISGASQLTSGTTKLSDGSSKLYDGSLDLVEGMNKLQDGSKELHDGIKDGAEEVKEVKTNNKTYEMFAEPIEDDETKITTVENNGHAMAPYMMSVGLWVGCLAFCLIYPLMSYKGELKSGLAWWVSKATVLYPVAILQGAALIIALNKLVGFHPVEYGKTIAFACLTAVTFTSIMYFFNIWLGKVGSFLMLVFMVVQLAGSAGTYPVELSPEFVSKIHDLVPFTYTVNAFRSTICGGENIEKSVQVLVVLLILFTAATIVSFHFKGVAKKKGKILPYDWLEERGLA